MARDRKVEMMIGTKIKKPLEDATLYAQAAAWCNESQKARIVDNGDFYEVIALPTPPEPTLDELKAQKKAEIAAARYEREIAGVEINGVLIDTGRDSQALITGAALAAMLDSEYSLNWKTAVGFIHLSASEIIAVAQAVRTHVQTCFDREGELAALVDAATTKEELDAIVISFE